MQDDFLIFLKTGKSIQSENVFFISRGGNHTSNSMGPLALNRPLGYIHVYFKQIIQEASNLYVYAVSVLIWSLL